MCRNIYFNLSFLFITISLIFPASPQHAGKEEKSPPVVEDVFNGAGVSANAIKKQPTIDGSAIIDEIIPPLNLTQKFPEPALGAAKNTLIGWLKNKQQLSTQTPQNGNNSENQNQNHNSSASLVTVNSDNNENNHSEKDVNSVENHGNADIQITEITEHPSRYRRFQASNYNRQNQNLQRYRVPQFYVRKDESCHIRGINDGVGTRKPFDEYDWYTVRHQNVYNKGLKSSQRKPNRPTKNSKRKQRPAQSEQLQYYNHSFLRPIRKQQNRKPNPSNSHLDYTIVPVTNLRQRQKQQTSLQPYPAEIIPISWTQKLPEQMNNFENNHQAPATASVQYVMVIPENLFTPKRNKKKQMHRRKSTQNKTSLENNTTEEGTQNSQQLQQQQDENSLSSFAQASMTSATAMLVSGNVKQTPHKKKDTTWRKPFLDTVSNENPAENIEEPNGVDEGDPKSIKTHYIVIGDDDNNDISLQRSTGNFKRQYFHNEDINSLASSTIAAIYKGRLFHGNPNQLEVVRDLI